MNPRKNFLAQCLCLAAAAGCAHAEDGLGVSERDYFEELPVVLSMSRLAQPLNEAPGAVTVIDRDMIRRSGARDLIDLFRLVPGFQVAKPPNGPGIVTYHGLAEAYPREMQVLLDGRSMYSPQYYGGVNWDMIPVALDDIERIEVVRGSNSASFGANAFLGIANIVTRHAADSRGATAEVGKGNQGVNDSFLRLGGGDGTVDFRLSAQSRRDDGIVSIPDRSSKRLFDARADIRLGLRDELQVQFGTLETRPTVGTAGNATDPSRMQTLGEQYLSLAWRRALEDSGEISARFYHTEERGSDAFVVRNVLPPLNLTVPIDFGFRTQRDDLEIQHIFRPWPDARLVWGGGVRTDSVIAPLFYGTAQPVALGLARMFGNLEWRLAKDWIANIGGTVERDSNAGTNTAPRLSINWHVVPGQTLRAGVSSAFRSPSLFESRGYSPLIATNGFVVGNLYLNRSSLAPERLIGREIGWLGEFRRANLTVDLRAFDEQVNDRLVTIQTRPTPPYCSSAPFTCATSPTAPSAYNAQDVNIRGIEYQMRWQPSRSTRLMLNQAFVRLFQQLRLPDSGSVLTQTAGVPSAEVLNMQTHVNGSAPTRNTTVMLMQDLPGNLSLSATYYSVGGTRWTQNTRVPSYTRFDWRLAYSFRAGPTRGELAFAVQGDGANRAEYRPLNVLSPRGSATLRLEY